MATYIKTLKEDNGDITYPQTKASAVLLDNGSDLETELSQYVTAEDIASTSALTPPVQTNMIAGAAVTSDKIDFTTLYRSATPLSATLPVKANTETNVQSLTLPAGKWRIFWSIRANGSPIQNNFVSGILIVNGDKVQGIAVNDTATSSRPYISCSYEANIIVTTTVSTRINMPVNGSVSIEPTYLFALRVG